MIQTYPSASAWAQAELMSFSPAPPLKQLGHLCSVVFQVSGKIINIYTSPNTLPHPISLPWIRRAQFRKQSGFTANSPIWTCRASWVWAHFSPSRCPRTRIAQVSSALCLDTGVWRSQPLAGNPAPATATLWLLRGAKSFFTTSHPHTYPFARSLLVKEIQPCTLETLLQ